MKKNYVLFSLISVFLTFALTGVYAPRHAEKKDKLCPPIPPEGGEPNYKSPLWGDGGAKQTGDLCLIDSLQHEIFELKAERNDAYRMVAASDYALRNIAARKWQYAPCQHALVGHYEAIKNLAFHYYADSTLAKFD
jgi:hypothetical protein